MTDNSIKVSQLPLAQNVVTTDRVMVLKTPSGIPSVRTITVGNLTESLFAAANIYSVAANSYANSVTYANSISGTAYANAVTYVNTVLAANLTNYATISDVNAASVTAYSNAVAFAANVTNIVVTFDANNWSSPAPVTIGEALERLAIVVKTLNNGTGA